jgi:hypothetical protein
MGGARMGEKRNAYRLLVGKPEGKRPLGRPRRRWLDNIRMDLVEVGWGLDWSGSGQEQVESSRSSSVVLTRLSGPRSGRTTSQKIW